MIFQLTVIDQRRMHVTSCACRMKSWTSSFLIVILDSFLLHIITDNISNYNVSEDDTETD